MTQQSYVVSTEIGQYQPGLLPSIADHPEHVLYQTHSLPFLSASAYAKPDWQLKG
jgi:hypothetical protein